MHEKLSYFYCISNCPVSLYIQTTQMKNFYQLLPLILVLSCNEPVAKEVNIVPVIPIDSSLLVKVGETKIKGKRAVLYDNGTWEYKAVPEKKRSKRKTKSQPESSTTSNGLYSAPREPEPVRQTYSAPERSYSGTCGARTKKGGACRRRVSGGGHCWQHGG
jgi:hypothetical protein